MNLIGSVSLGMSYVQAVGGVQLKMLSLVWGVRPPTLGSPSFEYFIYVRIRLRHFS